MSDYDPTPEERQLENAFVAIRAAVKQGYSVELRVNDYSTSSGKSLAVHLELNRSFE